MSSPAPQTSARKPRADAERNRERLILAAKAAFAEAGADVSLEEIARRAEVGIGTLYRHFPTRDAVVEAVYRRELGQLTEAAERLLAERTPLEALRAWLRLSVDYLATKRVIAPALNATPDGSTLYKSGGPALQDAISRLVGAALASGEVRPDVQPSDIFQVLAGVSYGSASPGWEASARRLIDIMVDGMRKPAERP
ncbi:MAG: TetR/AcrR family transcriptional regulator [Proteobacteria bacterium]|nr:TetR/AcrR family transcriptional regulator [Pseudomonadota bacterium]